MARLSIKTDVIKRLFALSGNQCAFPDCTENILNPKGKLVGQVCHIEAANKGGERFNPGQTDEQRRDFDNLILLCYKHHIETDDVTEFSAAKLKEIKSNHESKFKDHPYTLPPDSLQNILDEVNKKLDTIHDLSSDTNAKVTKMFELMNGASVNKLPENDTIYIAQLDMIKGLRKEHKHKTAIDLLLKYKQDNWNVISEETKYRVIANLGIAYYELQEERKGAETFMELEDIGFQTEDSLAYLALAGSVLDDGVKFQKYFDACKEINPLNLNLWIAYINYFGKKINREELIKSIPEELMKTLEISFKLGELIFNAGELKEGITYLKSALSFASDDFEKAADLRSIIASKILIENIKPYKLYHNLFTEAEVNEFNEADNMLSEAWELIKDTELAPSRYYVVMNRGVVRKILGKMDKALIDLQKAFELSKEFIAFKNLVLTYLQNGQLNLAEEALSSPSFKQDLSEEENFELATIRSRLFYLQKKIPEAVALLTGFFKEDGSERDFYILSVIISSYFEARLYSQAIPYCEKMLAEFPADISGNLFLGYLYYKEGQIDKALENYDAAYAMIDENGPLDGFYQLASGFMDVHDYSKAAELFEKIVDRGILNEISQGLIHAWYFSGNLQPALKLAIELSPKNPNSPFLAEIKMAIYSNVKDYANGISVFEDFIEVAPQKFKDTFLLNGARLYSSQKNWEKAAPIVLQIEKPLELGLRNCFRLSDILVKADMVDKGLELAYKARLKFYNEAEAHSSFMYLSTSVGEDKGQEKFPLVVDKECAVRLREASGKETVFLISDNEAIVENKLESTNDFAKQLMGKKINEVVIQDKGYNITHIFTVVEILNKYVFAFRESMELFRTKFAGQQGISILSVNPGEPDDELFKFIKGNTLDNQKFTESVFQLYNKRQATVGVLAQLFKRNTVKEWFNLLTSSEVFLYNYSHNEQPNIDLAINSKCPIVLDITALLTIYFIYPEENILNLLKHQYVVAQTTIDELMEFHNELEPHVKDGLLSVGYANGNMIFSSMDKETIDKHRGKILAIINWCKENTTITVPTSIIKINSDERNRTVNVLGECFHDTILLAKENRAVIMSDDDTFKNLSLNEHQITSFSTYQLCLYLASRQNIDPTIIEKFALQLILTNHIYIPPINDVLYKTYELSEFSVRKPFAVAVKGLTVMAPKYAVFHAVKFVKQLYLNQGLATTREQTILFLLRELSAHNNYIQIKDLMQAYINVEFKLLQNYRDDFLQLLTAF